MRPFAKALIRLSSGEGVGMESRPVSTHRLHPLPFYPFPSPHPSLIPSISGPHAFPHSSDKMAGSEEEEEEKVEGDSCG